MTSRFFWLVTRLYHNSQVHVSGIHHMIIFTRRYCVFPSSCNAVQKTDVEPWPLYCNSEDLRWRMVWQREALGYTYSDIAQKLCVDKSTESRTVNLFRTIGSVAKKPYPEGRAFCKLTLPAQLLILHLVLDRPGTYLREIQYELLSVLKVEVSESAVCKFLHKSGFTRQRLQVTALQQDEFLRQQFISEVSVYSPEMLVFIDETGTDRRGLSDSK